jgi:hypothetical protein
VIHKRDRTNKEVLAKDGRGRFIKKARYEEVEDLPHRPYTDLELKLIADYERKQNESQRNDG